MGTFDVFHPGHLYYLKQAAEEGDHLIVVVARDSTVKKEKGKMPLVREDDRVELVRHIDIVDRAVLGNKKDKLRIVEQVKPDVICLGYDHRVDVVRLKKELSERGLNGVRIKKMKPYRPMSYKSSVLKKGYGL